MRSLSAVSRPLSKIAAPASEHLRVRTQLALTRSISDELSHLSAADPARPTLEAQLNDELARLDRVVAEFVPESGEHSVALPPGG